MFKIDKDRATGLIVTVLGIFFGILSLRFPASTWENDPGPGIFPLFGCVILIICGTILALHKPYEVKEGAKKKPFLTKEEWKRFFVLLGAYLLYFFLLYIAGFIIATIISMFIVCTLFSEGKTVAVWKRILFAVAVTAGIYIGFYKGLGLRLPLGEFIRLDL